VPELIGKLGYDGRGFSSGLNQAVGEAKQAGTKISGYFASAFSNPTGSLLGGAAGAIGLSKAFEALNSMAEKVAEKFKLVKMGAREMHTDIETFQKIANITERSGTSPEAFDTFVDHIAEGLEKIRRGDEDVDKLARSFAELGVSIDDIKSKTALPIALQILGGFAGTGEPSDAIRAAMKEVGGRSGPSLIAAGQIGLDSRTALVGNMSKEQFSKMEEDEVIRRAMDAAKREQELAMGGFWHKLTTVVSGVIFNILHPGSNEAQLEAFMNAPGEALATSEATKETNAKRGASIKAILEKWEDDRVTKNQNEADAEAASDFRKEADKIRAEAEQAEMDNALAGKSPSERRQMLRDRLEAARLEEKRNRELASLEAPGSAAGERFLRDAEANRLTGLRIGHSLIESAQRGGGGAGSFDSLARIGGFTQNADVGLDLQERIARASERTATNTDPVND